MADITKALSIRAPWWWFILHGGKDIENRDWSARYRGPVLIHASKWWSLKRVEEEATFAECLVRAGEGSGRITYRKMRDAGGCIVGRAEIVDCVTQSDSPWFAGEYGFVLANPVAFAKPVPCKGMLSFFTVPEEVLAQIKGPTHG